MNNRILQFAIFCVEEVAHQLQLPGNIVYELLTCKSDILKSYVIPSFDVLHTQSRQYIVDDIISLMKERGVLA